uniref:WAP domain-containing protein n=1 Tax=Periophthalmus magnuspinnatus TaxID=409849 RepID=A0A3B3Z6R8_9GOBI
PPDCGPGLCASALCCGRSVTLNGFTLTKPGVCPKPRTDIAVEDDKCCSNGCGHTCQRPVISNALFTYLLDLSWSADLRALEYRAAVTQVNGINRNILNYNIESKPGSCPDTSPFFTTCKKECTDDSQCPENLKCCFSSCGLQINICQVF